jgi:hypothetical protein
MLGQSRYHDDGNRYAVHFCGSFFCCKILARARNPYSVPPGAGAIGEGSTRVEFGLAHQNRGDTAIVFTFRYPSTSLHINSIIIEIDSHHLVH